MSAWLMSIVGVVAVGVLLEIMLPEGETNKYIKGVFALAVVLVIVAPIPKLFKNGFDIENLFDSDKYKINQNYLNDVVSERNAEREKALLKYLKSNNYAVNKVKIYYIKDYDDVESAKIYLTKGISESDKNRIVGEIKNKVAKYLSIDESEVRVYASGEG